jgi:hypothetical protein
LINKDLKKRVGSFIEFTLLDAGVFGLTAILFGFSKQTDICFIKFCQGGQSLFSRHPRDCGDIARDNNLLVTEDMLPRACTCWFLVLLAYLLQRAWGLVDTEIVPTNAKYLMRWKQFEMGIGGTAKVSIDYNPNVRLPLRVYVCSPEEIKVLLDVYQR